MPINYTDEDLSTGPAASAGIANSFDVPPEQAAKAIEHGPAAGIPPAVGMRSPELVAQQALHTTQQGLIASSPPVAKWAATAPPAHVAVTKDDFPALGEVSRVLTAMKGTGDWVSDIAAVAGPAWQQLQTLTQKSIANPTGPEALNPLPAAGALANLIFSPMAGITEPLSRGLAASDAPLRDVYLKGPYAVKGLNTLPAPAPVLTDPADRLRRARDQVSAGVQLLLGTGKPGEVPLRPQAAAKEAGAGAAAAEPVTPPHPGVPPVGVHEGVDAVRTHVADVDVANVAKVQEAIAASQTHARSPAVMEAFLAQQTGDRTVSVDPDVLIGLAQEGHEPFPALAQDIHAAAVDGTPVEVPLSTYLARTAGQPYAEQLNAATSFRPDGVSLDESKELRPQADRPEGGRAVPDSPAFSSLTPAELPRARAIAAEAHAQLDEVVKAQRITELFTDAKSLGMTKPQFEAYGRAVDDAIAEAKDKLTARAAQQIMRERKPDWQAQLAQHVAAVEQELPNNRALVARAAIAQGKGPLGEPLAQSLRLDREDQLAQHSVDLGLPDRYFKKGGLPVDVAAELLGYGSGAELIEDLAALHEAQGDLTIGQHTKELVRTEAEARTRAELGYDLTPEAIHAAASEAINSPAITEFLATELRELAQLANLPFDVNTVKAYAALRFDALPVKQALNIRQLEGYVYKGGIKAEKALLKGDLPVAFARKQQQYIHQLMLVQAHKFAKVFAKFDRQSRRWAKNPVAKTINQEHYNYMRAILADIGVPVKTKDFEDVVGALQGKTLTQFMDELRREGFEPVHAEIPGPPVRQMTVDQFTGVNDMLTSLAGLGKETASAEQGAAAEALSQAVDTVRENATATGRKFTANELRRAEGKLGGLVGKGTRTMGSAVTRPETYLFWMDGEQYGPFMQQMVDPLQRAKHSAGDMTLSFSKDMRAFVKSQPKGWVKSLDQNVSVPELTFNINADGMPDTWIHKRSDLIMLALNTGTESNLTKLTEGFGWDPEVVKGVLRKHLTVADGKYVQFLLDQHEKLWPRIEAHGRALSGLAPKKEPAIPIDLGHSTLPGGYWPVIYDKSAIGEFVTEDGERVTVNDPSAMPVDSLFGGDYSSALPANRYTQSRTGFSAPLDLNAALIPHGFQQVIHDLAYREGLINAARFLRKVPVQQALREVLGPEYLNETKQWLQYIARQSVYDGKSLGFLANMIRGFRYNFSNVQIMYNLAASLKHAGIAAAHISGEVGVPSFARAVGDLLQTPAQQDSWMQFVLNNSGEVRNAMLNVDRDVRDAINKSVAKTGGLNSYQYQGYVLFAIAKKMEAAPTWLAKYRNLLDQGVPHEEARFLADKAVRDTQGAGSPVDLPAWWRGGETAQGEIGKLSNLFTGFLNTATNRAWTIGKLSTRGVRQFKEGNWQAGRRDFDRALVFSMAFVIIPAIYITLFEGADQKTFREHLLSNLFKETVGSFPGGSLLVDAVDNLTGHKKDFGNSPLAEAGKSVVSSAKNLTAAVTGHPHKVEARWVQHAAETVGYVTGIGTKPFAKTGQYLWDWTHNKVGHKSALEFARGVVFGPKTKAQLKGH